MKKFYCHHKSQNNPFYGWNGAYFMGREETGWFAHFEDGRKEPVEDDYREFDDFVFTGVWRLTDGWNKKENND